MNIVEFLQQKQARYYLTVALPFYIEYTPDSVEDEYNVSGATVRWKIILYNASGDELGVFNAERQPPSDQLTGGSLLQNLAAWHATEEQALEDFATNNGFTLSRIPPSLREDNP